MLSCRKILASIAMLSMLPGIAWGQRKVDYTKSPSHFPNFLAPYVGREVPSPSMQNSERIHSLIRDGKIMLSLSDAVALALENNLDLAIARYNLQIADTDILRTKSGASARGVASGLVQGTPGGGIGGFGTGAQGAGAGGTSGGAGGAGTGTGGQVSSTIGTGAPVQSYDPTLETTGQVEHAVFPLANTVTTGTAQFLQNSSNVSSSYAQAFATGTSLQFGLQNQRQTSNGKFTTLVPELDSTFRLTVTQRLLSGFGIGPNLRFIRIARNNREISDVAFRNQVIATVTQVQNIYWDLVNANEDVKVKERSQALAQKTLDDNKKQLELEAIAPIEVTKAEAEVDSRNQELLVAQTSLQLQQLLMKNAISKDLDDAELEGAEVVPTDTMDVPARDEIRPNQDLLNDALSQRPELAQARIDLTNREITRKAAKNALLPTLDVFGFYGGTGQGGVQNPFLDPDSRPPTPIITTGLGDVLSRTFRGTSPDYAVGFNMTIPLRNRAAQADQVRSELEYRQAQLRLRQLQNQIRIEVENAHYALQQNRARVNSAKKARDLAQRTFEIEQKKFALGASTGTLVLASGRDLAIAESNYVAAMTEYEKSRVELDRATGSTLERNGISIADAESASVRTQPMVHGAVPRTDQQ